MELKDEPLIFQKYIFRIHLSNRLKKKYFLHKGKYSAHMLCTTAPSM